MADEMNHRQQPQVAVQLPFRGDVSPLLPVRSTAKTSTRKPTSGSSKPHARPGRNRHTVRSRSAAGSGSESAANQTWTTARIGGSSPPDSGTRSAPTNGKAAPQNGAANDRQLKKNSPPEPARPPSQVVSDRQQPIGHDEDRSGNDHDCQHEPNHRL